MPKFIAPIDHNAQRLRNLATPTAASDAATKAYVDTAVAGAYTRISAQTVSTAVGSVTFSAIPSTAKALRVLSTVKSSVTTQYTDLRMQVNGVVTAAYWYQYQAANINTGVSALTTSDYLQTTSMLVGVLAPSTGVVFGANTVTLVGWDSPHTQPLAAHFQGGIGGNADNSYVVNGSGTFYSTLAYTSLTFFPATGTFAVGSEFVLEAIFATPAPIVVAAPFDAAATTIINVATPVNGTDAATKAYVDTRATGGPPYDANNTRVLNVATPTASTDAVNKAYVDTRPLDGGSQRVLNVATPTTSTDAANKAYVDARPLDALGSRIFNVAAPTTSTDAANKAYVDTRPLDAVSQRIVNVATPTATTDAATKAYVDTAVTSAQWKFQTTVTSAAVPTITISSIPSTLRVLRLFVTLRSDAAGTGGSAINLRVNQDVTAAYTYASMYSNSGLTPAATGTNNISNGLGFGTCPSTGAAANRFNAGMLTFVGWDSPHSLLSCTWQAGWYDAGVASFVGTGTGIYQVAGPYTRLDLSLAAAANFAIGSSVQAIGEY